MISTLGFQLVYVSKLKSVLRVERDGLPGFSCTKSAGRFSRNAFLSFPSKQTMGSLGLPSMLELRGLYRIDGKLPDGVTMVPWEMGKQLVWDVMVVDALAASRLNQGSFCNFATREPPPLRLKRVKLKSIAN